MRLLTIAGGLTAILSVAGTEKDMIPSKASASIFLNGYFVTPANRAERLYGNAVCVNPTQLQDSPPEPMSFRHAQHHIDYAAVDQSKVAGVRRNLHVGDPVNKAVKQSCR
jgi:hypothetical protein